MRSRVVVKFLVLLAMFSLLLNVFLPRASAEVMTHEKYSMDWSYSNSLGKYIRTEIIKNSSGQIAYCITFGLRSPDGEDLPEMGKLDNVVYRVLLNGFPQKSIEELGVANMNEAHYATQLAVWNALGQIDVNELKHENQNVEKAAKAIINAANRSEDTQDIVMKVIPAEKQKAELKGEYFETNLYTVQTNAKDGTFKVSAKGAPSDIRIVNEKGEVKEVLSIGEKFRIQIPKNTKTGEFNLNISADLTKMQAISYHGSDTFQSTTVLLERNQKQLSSDFIVNWEAVGSLKIKKNGENGELLAGAIFELLNENNETIGNSTTDIDGIAEFNNLPIGIYKIKEVKPPTGYVLSDKLQTVEIKTGETKSIQVMNDKVKGNVEIKKLSNSGQTLSNVEFTIFTEDNREVKKVVTAENGIAKVDGLYYGKYYFLETKTPNGYVGNKTKYPFEIKEHNKTLTWMIENTEVKGSVKLLKLDNEDIGKKLEGALFELKDEKGQMIGEYKTDQNGEINVKELAYGKYVFVEKESPRGFVLFKEQIPFEITENGKLIELLAVNKRIKGSLEISKVDIADGNNKLPGAEFTIYNEAGKEVAKGKTDDKGIGKFEKLPYGKYTYKETLAPEGYLINEETFSFEITKEGEIIKHTVKDKKITGSLEISKVDIADGNNKLPGAEFTIYNEAGKEVAKGKTDDKGIGKFEKLPYGKYTYKETLAPEGYLINEETFSFEITREGEIIKHTVKDQKKAVITGTNQKTEVNTPTKEPLQFNKEIKSKVNWLPSTGGNNLIKWISVAVGVIFLIVGGVLFLKRKYV